MKIIFFGHDEISLSVLKIIKKSDELLAIVLPSNRSKSQTEPLKIFAKKNIIKVFKPQNPNIEKFIDKIAKFKPDLAIVYNYSHIFKKPVISLFPLGMINIHGALLPQYQGANVINWVLTNGEKKTGITFHYINEQIDGGPIIERVAFPIARSDDALTLKHKIARKVPGLLRKILEDLVHKRVRAKPQKIYGLPRYFSHRKPEDGKIDFQKKPHEIINLVRALVSPWPGAFAFYKGKKVIFERATIAVENRSKNPGIIYGRCLRGINIATSEGGIILQKIRKGNKIVFPGQEFNIGESFQ